MSTRYTLSAEIGSAPVALLAGSSVGFTITNLDAAITGSGSGVVFLGCVNDVVSGETGTEWSFYPFDASDSAAQAYAVTDPSGYSGVPGISISSALTGPSADPANLVRYPIVVAPSAAMLLTYTGPDSLVFNLFIEE